MAETDNPPAGFSPTTFPLDIPFVDNFFPTYERVHSDGVDIGARVVQACCNAGRAAHGAFLMALGDYATSRAVFERMDPRERFTVHMNFNINFYAPAPKGSWLEARASISREGRSIVYTSCDFHADGELIGRADAILKCGVKKARGGAFP